jgi:hypothetical protein
MRNRLLKWHEYFFEITILLFNFTSSPRRMVILLQRGVTISERTKWNSKKIISFFFLQTQYLCKKNFLMFLCVTAHPNTTPVLLGVAKWLEGGHSHPTNVVEGWLQLLSITPGLVWPYEVFCQPPHVVFFIFYL